MVRTNPSAEHGTNGQSRSGRQDQEPAINAFTPQVPGDNLPGLPQCEKPELPDALHPLLDGIETNAHRTLSPSFHRALLLRDRLLSNIGGTFNEAKPGTLLAIASCSSQILVLQNEAGFKLSPALCRQRLCPICTVAKSYKLRARLESTIKRMKKPKLMTLTLRAGIGDLKSQAKRITKAFSRLRRQHWFQKLVDSGVWVLEYTYRPNDGSFHVHLHCVIDAHYLPVKALSDSWKAVTGDSFIVDIRSANSKTAGYLAKYIAKNALIDLPSYELLKYSESIHGLRMFGAWGGIKIQDDQAILSEAYNVLGTLEFFVDQAHKGDLFSLQLLHDLGFLPEPPDAPPPNSI